jgi:hypothetical protein
MGGIVQPKNARLILLQPGCPVQTEEVFSTGIKLRSVSTNPEREELGKRV